MIFRGTLRSVSYPDGLGKYMNSQGILLKEFDAWAQQCTRRLGEHVEAVARAAGRPLVYLASSAASKEEQALAIARRDGITSGLVCVLTCVEPCISAGIRRNAQARRLELVFVPRKCKFFYLYRIDPVFGWMYLRIQSWIPFDVQVYINGRTYLKGQLDRAGIGYDQHDNCFRRIEDLQKAQAMMDQLVGLNWATILRELLAPFWPVPHERCLPEGPERYYWTIRQSEVATDVMFRDAASLAAIYPRLCRHAIEGLSCGDILAFMGKSPSRLGGEVTSSYQKRIPGVRIKHQVQGNSIKMYDKGGSVLRVETTVNNPDRFRVFRGPLDSPDRNPTWRPMSKSVADIRRRTELCRAANQRYLGALASVGREVPTAMVLDPVTRPVVHGGKRHRGLRPVCPEDAALFAAVMDGRHLLDGFTNGALQKTMFSEEPGDPIEARRRSNRMGRSLRILRRHGLIKKIGARRLYRVTPKGHQVMGLALAVRQSTNMMSAAA